jgi:hypothetical protein
MQEVIMAESVLTKTINSKLKFKTQEKTAKNSTSKINITVQIKFAATTVNMNLRKNRKQSTLKLNKKKDSQIRADLRQENTAPLDNNLQKISVKKG